MSARRKPARLKLWRGKWHVFYTDHSTNPPTEKRVACGDKTESDRAAMLAEYQAIENTTKPGWVPPVSPQQPAWERSGIGGSMNELHVWVADWMNDRMRAAADAGHNAELHISGEFVENRNGGTVFKCPYNPFSNDKLADDYFNARKLVVDDRANMPVAVRIIDLLLELVVEYRLPLDGHKLTRRIMGAK